MHLKSKNVLTQTHTHPFNGPFSGTTQVSRYQKGKTNLDFTEARATHSVFNRTDALLAAHTTTQNKHKKLKKGLVAFYDIQSGNGAALFSKENIREEISKEKVITVRYTNTLTYLQVIPNQFITKTTMKKSATLLLS